MELGLQRDILIFGDSQGSDADLAQTNPDTRMGPTHKTVY